MRPIATYITQKYFSVFVTSLLQGVTTDTQRMTGIFLLVTLILGCHAQGYGYNSFSSYFPGAKGQMSGYEAEPQVTCSASFSPSYKDAPAPVFEGLSASFKLRRSPYAMNPFSASYLNFGGIFGKSAGSDGLSVELEIYSTRGGAISVIVTERAFPGDGCKAENFGSGLPIGHGGPVGYGAYGGFGGYGAQHGGTSFGYPGAIGFASPAQLFGGKGGYGPSKVQAEGVIAELELLPGTPKAISIDRLQGYTDLAQLAGRGLIVCLDVDSNYGGRAECKGQILSCCSLAYDNVSRPVKLGY